MSDLLKSAIADAKAVRETAIQNAKVALEEAFEPTLQSMLSAKLREEEDEEDVEEDVPVFGWLNMLIVVFCLVGYYFYKK